MLHIINRPITVRLKNLEYPAFLVDLVFRTAIKYTVRIKPEIVVFVRINYHQIRASIITLFMEYLTILNPFILTSYHRFLIGIQQRYPLGLIRHYFHRHFLSPLHLLQYFGMSKYPGVFFMGDLFQIQMYFLFFLLCFLSIQLSTFLLLIGILILYS